MAMQAIRINMTCCCGARFEVEQGTFTAEATRDAERWRMAHLSCPIVVFGGDTEPEEGADEDA